MALETIKLRKSSNTMTSVIVSVLIVMGIFIGSYLFIVNNVESAGLALDSKYNSSYENMTAAQANLEDNIEDIRDNFGNIKEADNTFEVAWNGLKGLGNTLKLPVTFVDTVLTTWTAIIFPTDIIPGWAKNLIFVGLLSFVVFLVLKILKGEPNM